MISAGDESGNVHHGSVEPTPVQNSFIVTSNGNGFENHARDQEFSQASSSGQQASQHSSEADPPGDVRAPELVTSPLSPSSAAAARFAQLDPQKMAYLKALAAREAYQQRMSGVDPEPLTALEEKQRLQRMYEEEELRAEQGQDAWNERSQNLPAVNQPSPPQQMPSWISHRHAASVDTHAYTSAARPDFTPQPSVYLTPDASISSHYQANGFNNNPYFESPNSSSTHLASNTSTLSQNYRRDPAVKQGKQRRHSSRYTDENDSSEYIRNNGSGESMPTVPPARPPKSRDVVYDSFKHLDTPVSPDASEYERRLLWGRQSQSSHYGH